MRGRCPDFVLSLHKALRLSWITLQIFIKGCRLRNHCVAIQVEMTSWAEKWLVRGDKPDQQKEGLFAAVFVQPCQRAVYGEVVRIHVVILLLGSDCALAPLLEEGIDVV